MPEQPRTAPEIGSRHDVLVERDVETPMRDGATLRSTVYRPIRDGRHPVLLSRLHYGRDVNINPAYFDPARAAAHGYVIMQDVRGRFASDGEFVPNAREADDGHDTIRWAASLPCSDGRVGMWGSSYHAGTQWRGASVGGLEAEEAYAAYEAMPLTADADGPPDQGAGGNTAAARRSLPGTSQPHRPVRRCPCREFPHRRLVRRFLPGHRIRVDVTSSSHPRWDRNLNTGATVLDSAEAQAAQQ